MPMRHPWYQALRELAARNGSVRVTPMDDLDAAATDPDIEPGATSQTCLTRLLAVGEDESLTLELPPAPGAAGALRQAAALDVLAHNEGQRLIGRCPVLEQVRYRLNERTGVLALRLGPAQQIYSGQRREFFRAELDADEALPTRLALVEPRGDEPRTPIEPKLRNLSGGGMGLLLEQPPADPHALIAGRAYHCRFQLPGDEKAIDVQAHLIHARPTANKAIYLGMAFLFGNRHEQRNIQEQIIRFTTALERKRLQRRRSA